MSNNPRNEWQTKKWVTIWHWSRLAQKNWSGIDSFVQCTQTTSEHEFTMTDYVWTSRTMLRDPETREASFDISYADGSWSRVPITALMDLNDLTFTHEAVSDAINDWIQVARNYPTKRRNCICCSRRSVKGSVLCTRCTPKYHAIVYAQ